MTSTDKEEVEGSYNFKTFKSNTMHAFFYSNISEFSGNLQGMLNAGTLKKNRICTSLVGRHNYSSPLMYRCWFMVVVFHNIFSFMTGFKNIRCYHIHIKEAIQVIRVANFCNNHGFLHYPNQLKYSLYF